MPASCTYKERFPKVVELSEPPLVCMTLILATPGFELHGLFRPALCWCVSGFFFVEAFIGR
jgi:hypothetical protein